MPLTLRSQQLAELLPVIRAGVRAAHLRAAYADDAVQQTLLALVPQLPRLAEMPERERASYVFVAASRKGMDLRKRVGVEQARGTDEEVADWAARHVDTKMKDESPEQQLLAAQGAARAQRALEVLATRDRDIVNAVSDDGLSEREVAKQLGISRGSVAYRLRRAREVIARAWSGTTSFARRFS